MAKIPDSPHAALSDGSPKPDGKTTIIEIPKIHIAQMEVVLVGDSQLVCHRWSEKAKKQMLGKQMKEAKTAKEAKDPHQDYLDTLYPFPGGGYGFPTIAFKAAAVSGCRFTDGVKMVAARGAFHVIGDLVKIEGKPSMREDMVRIAMGTADIRHRGEFKEWKVRLLVRYNVDVLSPAQIYNLFNLAGFGVGVGEGRPEKDGAWGMFHVEVKE